MPTQVEELPIELRVKLEGILETIVGTNGTIPEKINRLYDKLLHGKKGSSGITEEFEELCRHEKIDIKEFGPLGTLRRITNLA